MRAISLVAVDLTDRRQEPLVEAIDALHDSGLIGPCLVVDIGSPGEDGRQWSACYAGDDEFLPLSDRLTENPWERVSLVSVREALGSETDIQRRVGREEQLLAYVRGLYVTGGTKVAGTTLSLLGSGINDTMFPQNFSAHFVHEPRVGTDPTLPRLDVSDRNRDSVLAFVALSITGTGMWLPNEALKGLDSINDAQPTKDRFVRLIRVSARLAVSPPLVDDAVRKTVRPGGGLIPSGLPPMTPVDRDDIMINRVAQEFIRTHRFGVERFPEEEPVIVPVSWWQTLRDLLTHLPRYLKSSVSAEVRERVEKLTQPFREKLNDIAFGPDSTYIVSGVSYVPSGTNWSRFADELKNRLHDLEGISNPASTPDVWNDLLAVSFGLLDGGEFPDGIDPPTRGNRVIFLEPDVIGPSTDHDSFHLSPSECELLGIETKWAKPVGLFDTDEADELADIVTRGIARVDFRRMVENTKLEEERRKAEEEKKASRLRGPLLSRAEKLREKKTNLGESVDSGPDRGRDAAQIKDALDAWQKARQAAQKVSLVKLLTSSLDESMKGMLNAMRWDEFFREVEELSRDEEAVSSRRSRLVKWLLILLLPLMIVAFLLSSVFAVVTTVLGVPLLIFVFVAWLSSFGYSLARSIIKRALAARRRELNTRHRESVLTYKFRRIVHSINEFRRLQMLKMQFSDWQLFIREIVHNPYGRVSDHAAAQIALADEWIPPQFTVVHVAPSESQRNTLQQYVHSVLKVGGFLSEIEEGLRQKWRDDYLEAGVPDRTPPDSDLTSPGITPGLNHRGRDYLFPRRDYVDQTTRGNLRESALLERVVPLKDYFNSRQIGEIFNEVVEPVTHRAFVSVKPVEFLEGILRNDPPQFESSNLDAGRGGRFFAQNIDRNVSYVTPRGSTVDDYRLGEDVSKVLLGSTRVDVGERMPPSAFSSYVEVDGSHSMTTEQFDESGDGGRFG